MPAARCLLLAILCPALVYSQGPAQATQLDVVRAYLDARVATMQATARPADVDRVVAFCAPSVVYEHPRAGVRRVGTDVMREGMLSYLGASRLASITITASLPGRDVVAVQTDVAFEARDGDAWLRVTRPQTWVFEFEGSTIQRIIEYW